MLLIAIIPQTPNTNELLNTLYITAGTSGFGLLLTAIIQTALHRLSLFHAIFIMHILFFLGTGVSPLGKCSAFSCPCSSPPTYVGKYHWARSRIAMGVLLQYISVVSFTAWGLYLWVHVKDFGSQPECNDRIKYVFFFFTVRATVPWLRGLWIAGLVLSAVALMFAFGVMAVALFSMRRVERALEEGTMVARSLTPTLETSKKPWYSSANFPLLLCVASLCYLDEYSRITAVPRYTPQSCWSLR